MGFSVSLLVERERLRREAREKLRLEARRRLRSALAELVPGTEVLVVGSLAQEGRFSESSDVDLAIEAIPEGWSPYGLASAIEERVGRPVDLIELSACRFADKLRREGERWTA